MGKYQNIEWALSCLPKVSGPTCYLRCANTAYYFRLFHAFTCAGMLPQQFESFCSFAGIGAVKKHYMQASELFQVLSNAYALLAHYSTI